MTRNLIHWILSLLLIAFIGLTTGYSLGYTQGSDNRFPEIKTVPDINPGVATIQFLEVSGGMLNGKVVGQNARVAYKNDGIMEISEGHEFKIPMAGAGLKPDKKATPFPSGAKFVASKRGKKYYSVLDPAAQSLSVANRVFFATEEEAKKAGYIKK